MNTKPIVLIALFLGIITSSCLKAQDMEHKSAVSLSAGFSLSQFIFDADWASFGEETFSAYQYPAIQLTYDYRTNEWFSFGIGGSWQFYGIDVKDELLFDDMGNVDSLSYTVSIMKSNYAVKPLLHWKLNNRNMDLYTGIRMGVTIYSFDNGTNEDVSIGEEDMDRLYYRSRFAFSPQFVPLGFRGYFTDNIGMGVEFAIGAPHFLTIGFVGRF